MVKSPYLSEHSSSMSPAVAGIEIDTSLDTVLDFPCRALWVGSVGDLDVVMKNGQEISFKNVDGLLAVRVSVIKSSSTADDIVALY